MSDFNLDGVTALPPRRVAYARQDQDTRVLHELCPDDWTLTITSDMHGHTATYTHTSGRVVTNTAARMADLVELRTDDQFERTTP